MHKATFYLSNPARLYFFFLSLGLLTYVNGLNHPVIIDDHAFFGQTSHDPQSSWANFIPKKEVYYRPLTFIYLKLLATLVGSNVFIVHVANVLFFVTAAWLLARFLFTLSGNLFFGILTAGFMLVHPLNGIVVNLKTGGQFALQLIFLVSASHFLLISRANFLSQAYAVLLFIAALFCHESAFALPLCLFAIAMLVQKNTLKQAWQRLKPICITAGIYFLLRLKWASLGANIFDHHKIAAYQMGLSEALATWFSLQAWYFSKFFMPDGIVISLFKLIVRLDTDSWIISGVLLWSAAVWVAWQFFRKRVWVWVGLSWLVFLVLLMAVGSLFQGQILFIEPHWFVFTSIGFFMILADLVIWLSVGKLKKAAIAAAIGLGIFWMLWSWRYNQIWDDELTYSRFWLSQSPWFKPINKYIARAYFMQGKFDLAAQYYQMALINQNSDYFLYNNLGSVALFKKDYDAAKKYLEMAIAIEPNAHNALNSLGVCYASQGEAQKAEEYFKRAMAADPLDPTAKRNLDLLYQMRAHPGGANNQRIILQQ